MKTSDWESVKLKIGSMIQVVEFLLYSYDYRPSKYYFESLYNILEAKYIRIQKQELEREKEREEREAQREYERAIKNIFTLGHSSKYVGCRYRKASRKL